MPEASLCDVIFGNITPYVWSTNTKAMLDVLFRLCNSILKSNITFWGEKFIPNTLYMSLTLSVIMVFVSVLE